MKIAVLAPNFFRDSSHPETRDPFWCQALRALTQANHQLEIFSLKNRSTPHSSRLSKGLKLTPVSVGAPEESTPEETYRLCQKTPCPLEEPERFDLFLARDWTAEAWITAVRGKSGAKVLYFPHSPFPNPIKSPVEEAQFSAELRLLQQAIWGVNSRARQQKLRQLTIYPENILRIPTWTKDGSFRSREFSRQIEKIAERKETVFQGRIMTVVKDPLWHQGVLIPRELVIMDGSVHIIPFTAQGRLLFINERRLGGSSPQLRVISGSLEPKEKPAEAARRELKEETGITAQKLEKIMTLPASGSIKEKYHYFLARGLTFSKSSKETTEDIRGMTSLSPKELSNYLRRGKFGTSRAVNALLKLSVKLGG